ncbi:membrane protein [Candidatus Magnetoovum chiemensis]|nr:membrane protein [Candidatus Magnetoovum chiemensis]
MMSYNTEKDIIIIFVAILIVSVFVCLPCLVIYLFYFSKKTIKNRFKYRADLSPDEFYETFYRESGLPKDRVIDILNTIARQTRMPLNKLRPSDRFSMELSAPRSLGLEMDTYPLDLEDDLQDLIDLKSANIALEDLHTIDDCIRAMIALEAMEPPIQPLSKLDALKVWLIAFFAIAAVIALFVLVIRIATAVIDRLID